MPNEDLAELLERVDHFTQKMHFLRDSLRAQAHGGKLSLSHSEIIMINESAELLNKITSVVCAFSIEELTPELFKILNVLLDEADLCFEKIPHKP
jgi:hypothetical protein